MDQAPKQLVAEKLRSSSNVLITVSKNPSVDQLAAAIGLSLMMNKLGKHTATVFSGQIPDIISFLEPEKTFDNSVDGLRDFIISLSKDKADKLRYKVEDDVVKIFITPYKTKISEKDLDFEQGDFNVDIVLALGVKKRADLDEAITAHGRILHDATVVAVNAGAGAADVGSIDWIDDTASSLCEMLVSISEALEGGVLDSAMSTAFLTGIVSVTDRFSNQKTTPKLMTMSAQLMAAGANQQLISEKLQLHAAGLSNDKSKRQDDDPSTLDLSHDKRDGDSKKEDKKEPEEFKLDFEETPKDEQPKEEPKQPMELPKPKITQDEAKDMKLDELEKQLSDAEDALIEPKPKKDAGLEDKSPQFDQSVKLPQPSERPKEEPPHTPTFDEVKGRGPRDSYKGNPSLGGTFNATSQQASIDKQNELKNGLNDEILSHDVQPLNHNDQLGSTPAAEEGLDDARRAVEQAMSSTPFKPDNNPMQSINAQPFPQDPQPEGNIQPPPVTIMPGQPQQGPPASPPPMAPPPMPSMGPPPPQSPPIGNQSPMGPPPPSGPQTFNLPQNQMGPPPPTSGPAPMSPQNPMAPPPPPGGPPPNGGMPAPPPPPIGNNFPPPPQ